MFHIIPLAVLLAHFIMSITPTPTNVLNRLIRFNQAHQNQQR